MARITVEDCLDKVDNRFELVMIASKRARQLQIEGKDPMLPVDNDKPTVIALREIADGMVSSEILIERPSIELEDEFANAAAASGADEAAEAEATAADSDADAGVEEANEAEESDASGEEEDKPAAEE